MPILSKECMYCAMLTSRSNHSPTSLRISRTGEAEVGVASAVVTALCMPGGAEATLRATWLNK